MTRLPLRIFESPLGLVPKKAPGEFRLIHHLSFPEGSSVNDSIPRELSSVQYATIDDTIKKISSLSAGCFLAKTDIKSAFHIIPLHPQDFDLLDLEWEGKFYFDRCLPMGCLSSCDIFETFSTALEWIASTKLQAPAVIHNVTSHAKTFLTDSRFRTDSCSVGVCQPFERLLPCVRKISLPFEQLLPCVQKKFLPFERILPCVRKKFLPFEWLLLCVQKKFLPFERILPCVRKKFLSFERLLPCIQKNFLPFKRILPCVRKKFLPFERLLLCVQIKEKNNLMLCRTRDMKFQNFLSRNRQKNRLLLILSHK